MSTQRRRILSPTLLAAFALIASACAPAQVKSHRRDAGPVEMPSSGTPLDQVSVPSGFNFEATQRVDVHVSAPSSVPAGSALTIERENGAVIFRGAVPVSRHLTLVYPLPKHEHTLRAIFRAADGTEHTQTVQISSDQTATSTLGQE